MDRNKQTQEEVMDIIIFFALMMSLGPSIGMVWLFRHLVGGGVITGDKYNEAELIASICILALVVIALISFTVRKMRE